MTPKEFIILAVSVMISVALLKTLSITSSFTIGQAIFVCAMYGIGIFKTLSFFVSTFNVQPTNTDSKG